MKSHTQYTMAGLILLMAGRRVLFTINILSMHDGNSKRPPYVHRGKDFNSPNDYFLPTHTSSPPK